jgi:hypothetical protein
MAVSCILILAAIRGEWLASRPGRFTVEDKAPIKHWIEGSVAPEQSGRLDEGEISYPCGNRITILTAFRQ